MGPSRWLRRAAMLAVAGLVAACGGEAFQPTHTGVVPVGDGASVGQTFRSASGDVNRLDLLVATYGRAADPGGTLTVTLLDDPGGRAVARAQIPGERLEDNTWVAVRFDRPVPVGEHPAFEVGWDSAGEVALRANVPPAEVGADRLLNDPYPGGQLLRDGRPAAGDLAFRVTGGGTPGAVVAAVARLARGAGAHLLARPLFAAGWLALLGGAVVLAVRGLRVRFGTRQQRRTGSNASA